MKIFALNILGYLVTSSDVQLGKSAHIVNALLKARWWCYDTIHQVISIFGENPSWQSLFSDKRSVECTVQSRFSDTKFSGNLFSMQLFSTMFSFFFCPWKIEKTTQKSCSESAQTPFSHCPAQATANSPKLIFHVMKFRDQTSVLLSVVKCTVRLIESTRYFGNV